MRLLVRKDSYAGAQLFEFCRAHFGTVKKSLVLLIAEEGAYDMNSAECNHQEVV